jgi:hypothetical protein
MVVAFHQYGKQAGDRTGLSIGASGAGGSPADRPISRWAMAKRVTESISSSTFSP